MVWSRFATNVHKAADLSCQPKFQPVNVECSDYSEMQMYLAHKQNKTTQTVKTALELKKRRKT